MYTNLPQRAFSIVGGARQSLLSVRNPSESESIFFMIDCSRLCCSSWPSLTYSSTSSFGEGNHTQENQVLQSVGYNSGGKKGYHMPHWHQRFQDDPHFLSSIRPPYHLKRSCPLSFSNRKDIALELQQFHQLYRPQGPLERKRRSARPPLSGRPSQGLGCPPSFVPGQSPWRCGTLPGILTWTPSSASRS